MTELTPRQLLLEQVSDRLDNALQSDLEHGLKSLNEQAAETFKRNYPALNNVITWINNLYMEEMPYD